MSLEDEFMSKIVGTNILTIGTTESGKTYLCIKILYRLLEEKKYDQYHLVLPHYKTEMNNSYAFLKQFKQHVYIYNKYDDIIVDRINSIKDKQSIFFLIDDATGYIDNSQTKLQQLMTGNRHGEHGKSTIWIIGHGAKIAKRNLRNVVKYIFITTILNRKVLYDIYEEFLSMKYENVKEGWLQFYNNYQESLNEKYHQLCISLINNGIINIDYNVNKWKILNIDTKTKQKPIETTKQTKEQPKKQIVIQSERLRRLNFLK
jgi:hypothetical protein